MLKAPNTSQAKGAGGIMSQARRIISVAALHDFVGQLFKARGMAAKAADQIADLILYAELSSIASHGVTRLPGYLGFIDRGDMDPKASPQITPVLGSCLKVDGHKAAGPVTMMAALEALEPIVRTQGIGLALVSNTTHTGAVGYYAHWAAQRGLASLIMIGGVPNMAYHGARIASLATGPLTIGVPGGPQGPIVLDMATSVAAWGRLRQAKLAGLPIPAGWALDDEGHPTQDPTRAITPLPIAGPKGSGLSFMFECLASLLAGAPILNRILGPEHLRQHTQNASVILMDVAAFRPLDEFARDVHEFAKLITTLPPIDGAEPIRLPGERSQIERARHSTEGLSLSPSAWADLTQAAQAVGLPLPQTH